MGMEMIERVAKAIYETEPFAVSLHREIPWADVDESQKEGFRVKAVAAIEAMREPSAEMKAVLGAARKYGTEGNGDIFPRKLMSELIDAALKESEERD